MKGPPELAANQSYKNTFESLASQNFNKKIN